MKNTLNRVSDKRYLKTTPAGLALLLLASFTQGCATTNRTKTILGMLAGGGVGSAVGYVTPPPGTDPVMHGAYWGLAGAAVMGVAGLFLFDEQKRSESFETKLQVAQKELNALRFGGDETASDEIVESGSLSSDIPNEMRPFFSKMKWKRKRFPNRLTHWMQRGDNSLVRECEVFEFSLPGIKIPSAAIGLPASTDPRLMDQKTMSQLLGAVPEKKEKIE